MKVSLGMLTAMVLFVSPHISLAKFATKSVEIELLTEEDMPPYTIPQRLYVEGCLQEAHNIAMSEVDDYKIEMVKISSETDEEIDFSELVEEVEDDGDYDDEYDSVDDGDFEDDDDAWRKRNRNRRQLWSYKFGPLFDYKKWREMINEWLGIIKVRRHRWTSQTGGSCAGCDDSDPGGNGYEGLRKLREEGTELASEYFCECVTEKSPFPSFSKIHACGLTFDHVHVIEGQDS